MSLFQPLQGQAQVGAIVDVTNAEVVRALKTRVDPTIRALDAEVASCPSLDPAMRTAYLAFSASWRAYFAADDSGFLGFGTATIFDTGKSFEAQALTWQQTLSTRCVPSSPFHTPDAPQSEQAKAGISTLRLFGWAGLALGAGFVIMSIRAK